MKAGRRYGKVTDNLVALLTEIVGNKNILTGDERENYSRDETLKSKPVLPEVVVKPGDTASVARIMKIANERNIPVTPRGGGTGLSGGAIPIYGGIVLSLERMNRILEIDGDNFSATVEPGVTLADFYQAVEERGLYYPLYPGEKSATIGGNVATNAGGIRAVKYGVTRHFVLGLEAVLPTGETIPTGGKFVKCSTGYDLTQLIIGSEGTLALITKVTLKLITPPARREILFIPFHGLHSAIGSVPDILKEGILPVGIEFMERDIINMVEQYTGREIPLHGYEAYLMIIVEADSEDEICHISNRIGDICLNHGAVDVFIPGSQRAKRNLLDAREKFYPAIRHCGILDMADVVVPRSRIAEFVERVKKIGNKYGIPIVACGHAGDGNVHLHPMGQETAQHRERVKKLLTEIYKVGISLGGTISGEHGLGLVKKGYLHLAADKDKIDLMKRLKRAFDPNNILNPGKVIDID
ncbi:putative FAD-linked oxidoreductase [subsurface metagenome]